MSWSDHLLISKQESQDMEGGDVDLQNPMNHFKPKEGTLTPDGTKYQWNPGRLGMTIIARWLKVHMGLTNHKRTYRWDTHLSGGYYQTTNVQITSILSPSVTDHICTIVQHEKEVQDLTSKSDLFLKCNPHLNAYLIWMCTRQNEKQRLLPNIEHADRVSTGSVRDRPHLYVSAMEKRFKIWCLHRTCYRRVAYI